MRSESGGLKHFLWGVIGSGLPYTYDLESLRKVALLNLIILLGCTFLTLLGILAFFQQDFILGAADSSMLVFLVFLFRYLRNSKNIELVSNIGTAMIGVFYFFIFLTGGVNQTAFVWYYTYPLIAVFLLGNKRGSIATFGLLLPAMVVFAVGNRVSWFPVYRSDLILRFIPSYLTVYLFTLVMEKTRSTIQERLRQANRKQEKLIGELEAAKIELMDMSIKDGLTGLFNRRYFDEILALTFKQIRRSGGVLALLMLDVDHFKKFNDRYGHLAGDETLTRFGTILSSSIRRETDMVFRYGGEEFTIILFKANRGTAERIAGTIIQNLEAKKIVHEDSPTGILSSSIGIATYNSGDGLTKDELVRQADDALYRAKKEGGAQYVLFDDQEAVAQNG